MQARQHGRMEQRVGLLPKMLQSIEVLQLTTAELLARIDRELECNETLVAEPIAEVVGENEAALPERSALDGALGEGGSAPTAVGENRNQAFLQSLPDHPESLEEYIAVQLGWFDLPATVVDGVRVLAAHLDCRGLLPELPSELAGVADGDLLDECVAVLQSLEPRGVGAAGPVAAMLLQVPPLDPDLADITALLTEHLDALARNKIPEVARRLGRSIDEVRALLARIKRLDPHPGAAFGVGQGAEPVQADVVVRLVQGKIEVEVDEMSLPDLGIQPDYAAMARDRATDREVRGYLRDKLRSAQDLIFAVEQRRRTLARATLAIMARQRDFLIQGPLAVRTLSMEQIAADLDVHASTVSRAIAGKFCHTDHGIFRLRDFFDADRRVAHSGRDSMGRLAIRDHIRDLVAAEDPENPLSDDEIATGLLRRKIKVARRTVAKYRMELGLASSWRRRRFEESE